VEIGSAFFLDTSGVHHSITNNPECSHCNFAVHFDYGAIGAGGGSADFVKCVRGKMGPSMILIFYRSKKSLVSVWPLHLFWINTSLLIEIHFIMPSKIGSNKFPILEGSSPPSPASGLLRTRARCRDRSAASEWDVPIGDHNLLIWPIQHFFSVTGNRSSILISHKIILHFPTVFSANFLATNHASASVLNSGSFIPGKQSLLINPGAYHSKRIIKPVFCLQIFIRKPAAPKRYRIIHPSGIRCIHEFDRKKINVSGACSTWKCCCCLRKYE
jgi:hypothetical protein